MILQAASRGSSRGREPGRELGQSRLSSVNTKLAKVNSLLHIAVAAQISWVENQGGGPAMKSICIAIFAGMLTSSAASGETTDMLSQCGKIADAWKAAYNSQDADGLAKMYDAKAGMFSNAFWTATGHDALLTAFKKDLAAGVKMTTITCERSNRTGDLAISSGAWTATGKGPGGKDTPLGGHWLTVGQYQGDNYSIVMHNGNMQLPPAAPAK